MPVGADGRSVGRADGRAYGHVTTKISRMHRSPNFLTHRTPLRASRTRELRYQVENNRLRLVFKCFKINKTTTLVFICVVFFSRLFNMLLFSPTPCEMETGNKTVSVLSETYDVVRELIQRSFFNRRSLTGSDTFSLLTALDATKFVLLCILTLKDTIGPFIRGKIRRVLNKTRTGPVIRACLI